jgi:PAS domain S-box-containing protein
MVDRIMLVEDEMIVAMDTRQRLQRMGYDVVAHAISGEEAIRLAKETKPNLVLMDIKIQGKMDGIETAAMIRENRDIPVIYVTAYSDESTLKRARLTEPFGYLIKPFEDRELRSIIEIAIYKHQIEYKLRESEERYRKVIETSPDGIATADLDGNLISVNQRFVKLWGYESPDEMIGLNYINLVDPEDHSEALINLLSALQEKNTTPFEHHFRRKDGSTFIGEINATGLHDAKNQLISSIAIVRDITDRKKTEEAILNLNTELEQRVAARTASLEASNKELEAFSYSVAHDLRTPLRTMISFSQIFLEEYSPVVDEKGQDYLKRILNSSRTMAKLIDDLLNLSSITRAEIKRADVDLAVIARSISRKLHDAQPDRKAEFIFPEKLMANSDPGLIQLILENLLGNAWKFSINTDIPRIELGSMIQNGEVVFFVKDNGVGFDMAFSSKLFGAFQRLHSLSEFDGNGIGLSIVQRIILRHGGRAWAESEVGKGATFFFTLP